MLDLIAVYSGVELLVILAAYIIAVTFAIVFHEFAHGYIAYKNGDDTAKLMGRLTLNPIKHFDLLGTICFILMGFGWAKPVPINPLKFRNYKKGVITTSIAGVITNFILGFVCTGLYVMCLKFFNTNNYASMFLIALFNIASVVNFSLMVFNLLPIYPLDGFNVLSALLPYSNKLIVFLKQYGQIILLILMFTLFRTGAFSYVTYNIFNAIKKLWFLIWGL